MAEKIEFLVREEGSEEVERNPVADKLRSAAIHIFDAHEREVFVPFARRADLSGNGIAVLKAVLLDLLLGNVDIVGGVEIIVVG